jgi:RNA polymerase sigma-70 factor (ECF subfamily)
MPTELEHLTDEELMCLVQKGDLNAFSELARRYEQKLLNFLRRFVGNLAQAEDLLQATLLRVYRARARFKGNGKFSTWLYTIAANLARDYLRKTKKYRFVSLEAPVGPSSNVIDFCELKGETAFDSAQKKEISGMVRLAVEKLPHHLRMTILLSHYEEMSYEDIARVLGCSKGTVKSRVFRAKMKLKEFLADYLAGKEVARSDELQEDDQTTAGVSGS